MNQQEALTWIAKVFDDSVERVHATTLRKDIAGWDSMGTLLLLADLDEKFNIHLTEEQIEQLSSVGDVLAVLRQHGALDVA